MGVPLILYLIRLGIVIGAMLDHKIEGEERDIYYISKKFLECEICYMTLEKNYPNISIGNKEAQAMHVDPCNTRDSSNGSYKLFTLTTPNQRQGS